MALSEQEKLERRAKWDSRYVRLARHISRWSKDPNAQIGAIITNPQRGMVVAMGFNGFPQGVGDDPDLLGNQEEKLLRVLHAEQNALIRAGRDAEGCNIYVVGKPVCNVCAALLIEARIDRIVARRPHPTSDGKWEAAGRVGLEMIEESGVKFSEIDPAWLKVAD